MDGTAIIYTQDKLSSLYAKTAHGLLRHGKRYEILAVLDRNHAGEDAGMVIDGKETGIPIVEDLHQFLVESEGTPDFLIIGIASPGGRIDPAWMPVIEAALRVGISIVNGMHHKLVDIPELVALAASHGAELVDVRTPKPIEELAFWTGKIKDVDCPIIPILGTDCAVGKRTTARFLEEGLKARGIHAPMVYTGQTGWLQGGKYGFIFDSTLNDFVCGELEASILACWEQEQPDVILVEGQAALCNPSGPCGSEMLVSGRADACILVHHSDRKAYDGWEELDYKIAPLANEVALIGAFGVPTIGVALNTQSMTSEEARLVQEKFYNELGLPISLPLESGVDSLVDSIQEFLGNWSQA